MTRSSKSLYKKADSFTKLAYELGYRSRAAFKLSEIQDSFRLIRKGDKVLDLGCYPGSWSQVCLSIVGKQGKVVGIDKRKIDSIEGIYFINKDIQKIIKGDFKVNDKIIIPVDVVLSDIAPNISGISSTDEANMTKLLENVFILIQNYLKVGGSALVKVFSGDSLDQTRDYMKSRFEKVRIRKPKASRSNSKESYVVGIGLKNYE